MANSRHVETSVAKSRLIVRREDVQRYAILLALIAVVIISALISETFIQPRNLMNIGRQISVNGILAVGMTAVILSAGIDLSVGSLLAFMGVVMALLCRQTEWYLGVLGTLGLGLLLGLTHGYFVAKVNVPPFIVTLAGLTIYRGLALVLTDAAAVPLSQPIFFQVGSGALPLSLSLAVLSFFIIYALYQWVLRNNNTVTQRLVLFFVLVAAWVAVGYLVISGNGIPYPVLAFILVAVLGNWVLTRTTFGRHVYAVGGNVEAAKLSGVKVDRILITVYTAMTLLATLAAIVLAARLNSGTPRVGQAGELDAIGAVIIGGTSLAGGSGGIGGSIIGVLLIGVLNNLLSLMNVDSNVQLIIKGLIILGAVVVDASARKD